MGSILDISKIKKNTSKFFRKAAGNFFLSCLVVFLLASSIAGLLFYYYCFVYKTSQPEPESISSSIRENIYQEISNIWQTRQEKFLQTNLEAHPNPFNPAPKPASEEKNNIEKNIQ